MPHKCVTLRLLREKADARRRFEFRKEGDDGDIANAVSFAEMSSFRRSDPVQRPAAPPVQPPVQPRAPSVPSVDTRGNVPPSRPPPQSFGSAIVAPAAAPPKKPFVAPARRDESTYFDDDLDDALLLEMVDSADARAPAPAFRGSASASAPVAPPRSWRAAITPVPPTRPGFSSESE